VDFRDIFAPLLTSGGLGTPPKKITVVLASPEELQTYLGAALCFKASRYPGCRGVAVMAPLSVTWAKDTVKFKASFNQVF
jgi:hypothetical protein